MQTSIEKNYSVKEAADILGFSYQTVSSMCRDGRLKCYSTGVKGGKRRVTESAIQKFIELQQARSSRMR